MGSFRKTRQNTLIFDIINQSFNHLTALEVHHECLKKINNISLGTVYRNLNNLVDQHRIRKLIDLNGVEHFDNFKVPHNHFVCTKCMQINDVYNSLDMPLNCEFGKVIDYEIFYKGICNNCLHEEEK